MKLYRVHLAVERNRTHKYSVINDDMHAELNTFDIKLDLKKKMPVTCEFFLVNHERCGLALL
jgi:hypothetical protein